MDGFSSLDRPVSSEKCSHGVESSYIQKAYPSSRSQSRQAVHLPREAGGEGTVEKTLFFGS